MYFCNSKSSQKTHVEGLERKKNFYSFVMKMIFPRYKDVSEDESE